MMASNQQPILAICKEDRTEHRRVTGGKSVDFLSTKQGGFSFGCLPLEGPKTRNKMGGDGGGGKGKEGGECDPRSKKKSGA